MGVLKDNMPSTKGRPFLVASSIFTALFNTLALLLIARNMGAEILGSLGFMLSFIGMFYFVGDMGNTLAFDRVLAKGFRFGDCYRAFMAAKFKMTVGLAVVSGLMLALYIYILAPETHTALHPASLVAITGYFLVANMAQTWVVSLAIRGRVVRSRLYDFLEGVVKAVMIGALIWLGLFKGDQPTIFQLAFIYLAAATMGLMIVRNSARSFKKGNANEELEVEFHDEARKLLPFIAFAALALNLDKVLLWFFTEPGDSFELLGVYFGAQRITIFIGASAVAIESMLGGALGRYIRNGESRSISETLRMTERYVSLVVLPVACFYVMFADPLLTALLGEEFSGAGIPVAILAGAGFFTALGAPHLAYMVRDNRVREITMVAGLGLATLVASLLLFLPETLLTMAPEVHGMTGAALSVLLASLVMYAMTRYFSWKLLGCEPHRRMLVHPFCAGIMMASIQFVVWYFSIELTIGWLLIFALFGVLVYGLALYLAGEMIRKDYHEFKELTKPE